MDLPVLPSQSLASFADNSLGDLLREQECARKRFEEMIGFARSSELARLVQAESQHRRFIEETFFQTRHIEAIRTSVVKEYLDTTGLSAVAHFANINRDLSKHIAALNSSVLQSLEETASLVSLPKLSAIGYAVKSEFPFGSSATDTLRDMLGHWAVPSALPESLTALGRLELYRDRGFDSDLLRLPATGIRNVLEATDLRFPAPPIVVPRLASNSYRRSENGIILAAPKENQNAYAIVYHFERYLRKFIVEKMSTRYGLNWEEERVEKETLKRWKKQAARAGQSGNASLIDFADLPDYAAITTADEPWEDIFAAVFVRRESIRESMQRLRPLRSAIMHSRPLIPQDLILVYAEAQRVLRAIGANLPGAGLEFE